MHAPSKRSASVLFVAIQLALFAAYFFVPQVRIAWTPAAPWRIPGLILLLAGSALSTAGMWSIRRHITPFPHPLAETRLVTSGPFAITRHPIYTGLLGMALGWALWTWSPSRALTTLALGLFFWWKASFEERLLEQRFPGAYTSYTRKVKRLFPW